MNKIKLVKKSGGMQLIIKGAKGQQIMPRELNMINRDEISGLLRINLVQKKNSFKFICAVTGFETLVEFLRTPLNRESFAQILRMILANLKAMREKVFNTDYVLLDIDKVMVNPHTSQIYFIYVPIQRFEGGGNLRTLLLAIIQHCSFQQGEDTDYVQDYINILNNGVNFSEFDLEQYIKRLTNTHTPPAEMVECKHCHAMMPRENRFCTACGHELSISPYPKPNGPGIYDPIDDPNIAPTHNPIGPTGGIFSDVTTVLFTNETSVLCGDTENDTRLYLLRKNTGEKMPISRSVFRVGKEEGSNDYVVRDNSAVSRKHAEILIEGNHYFIVDKNSTNYTYVDGRVISPNQKVEIFSDTKIRLANEDFVFLIE